MAARTGMGFGWAFALALLACGSTEREATNASAATELVPQPADNPSSPDKVALGRLLFWDPILSGDRDVACASCHDPAYAYADGRALSIGTGGAKTAREALTVLDTAWNGRTASDPNPDPDTAPMFWDNRARSLESQASGPLTGPTEMLGTNYTATSIFPELVARLSAIPEYASRFAKVFGARSITERDIVCAIASFERTLVTTPSFEAGTMSAAATRGQDTFHRLGCAKCHSGPMLSDYTLHRFTRGGEAIRTPSLRNVTRTAPYMHDGRAATLDAVFDIYRRVDHAADPSFDGLRAPDREERDEILAFLAAASDGDYDQSVPASVPSGLRVGGRRP